MRLIIKSLAISVMWVHTLNDFFKAYSVVTCDMTCIKHLISIETDIRYRFVL